MIREWQRLREWVTDSRDEMRLHCRLTALANEWQTTNQDKSYPARGTQLNQLATWSKTTDLILTETEQDYLQQSIAERAAQ